MRDIRNHQFYLDKTLRYICGALYLEAFSAFREVSSKYTGISITAFDRMNLNDKDIIDSSVFPTGHVLLYFSSTPSLLSPLFPLLVVSITRVPGYPSCVGAHGWMAKTTSLGVGQPIASPWISRAPNLHLAMQLEMMKICEHFKGQKVRLLCPLSCTPAIASLPFHANTDSTYNGVIIIFYFFREVNMILDEQWNKENERQR